MGNKTKRQKKNDIREEKYFYRKKNSIRSLRKLSCLVSMLRPMLWSNINALQILATRQKFFMGSTNPVIIYQNCQNRVIFGITGNYYRLFCLLICLVTKGKRGKNGKT
jgi:hypothetical protein